MMQIIGSWGEVGLLKGRDGEMEDRGGGATEKHVAKARSDGEAEQKTDDGTLIVRWLWRQKTVEKQSFWLWRTRSSAEKVASLDRKSVV